MRDKYNPKHKDKIDQIIAQNSSSMVNHKTKGIFDLGKKSQKANQKRGKFDYKNISNHTYQTNKFLQKEIHKKKLSSSISRKIPKTGASSVRGVREKISLGLKGKNKSKYGGIPVTHGSKTRARQKQNSSISSIKGNPISRDLSHRRPRTKLVEQLTTNSKDFGNFNNQAQSQKKSFGKFQSK